jgi:soluble lytic murein transglycosylase-like protein
LWRLRTTFADFIVSYEAILRIAGKLLAGLTLVALAGCATQHRTAAVHRPVEAAPAPAQHYYPPPGPPEDPWGPYIRLAAARFAVPEVWIRAIMQQESGGDLYQGGTLTTSPIGAMGLMQVMPDTYEILRDKYGLGRDPYEPRDNIIAGAAYIREMYDAYGYPAFIAAYNAGPDQLAACLTAGQPLPQETVSYLTAVAPRLRPYAKPSGLLAAYADLPPEMPADDLNRRSILGLPLAAPARASAVAPVLPCTPPLEDHSADDLNRAALAASGMGASGGGSANALNQKSLAGVR